MTSSEALLNRFSRRVADTQTRLSVSFRTAWDLNRDAYPEELGLPPISDPVVALCNRLQAVRGGSFKENWNLASAELFLNARGGPTVAAPRMIVNRAASALANRVFVPAPDNWIALVRPGEFPHEQGLQILDSEAMTSLFLAFERDRKMPNFPGLLIDFDHFSADTSKPSEAAGWI
jgi:hypothetical protein